MEAKKLKKLLSGLSVLSLLAGSGIGVAGPLAGQAEGESGIKHPTPGSSEITTTG
jgi:hypothetical protein